MCGADGYKEVVGPRTKDESVVQSTQRRCKKIPSSTIYIHTYKLLLCDSISE